ncbi:sensor histidine kinase [Acidicapsa dinghuensis]|uniref:histidine kinase n=1 Tax=Acidicapsa dinghuensis TaxID=2218256 RepID=A0ABW1EBY6_9BACT|nr:ATP-binding protein [Acidicapsa dinghuensis]
MRPRYIRGRLTLWYAGIFGIVLAIYICGACGLQYWQLNDQLHHAEIEDLETVEGLLYFTPDGRLHLREDYHSHPQSRLLLDRYMEVLSPQGDVLLRNERLGAMSLGGAIAQQEGNVGYAPRRWRLEDGTPVLAISHIHILDGKPLLIRLAYSTEPLRTRLLEFLGLLILAMPIALIAAAFAGYRVAGKALNPLEEMARRTEQITARRLNERIVVENPDDEFGHMARVLNGLLARLGESFEKLQHFTSDVSHELRTPLASIRSVGEVGLQEEHSAERYRDIIGSMLEEVARLTGMIDTLLTIAQADSGEVDLHRTTFVFAELVQESVTVVSVLAEDKKQNILVTGESELEISADRGFLRMAVINLLDNAVKYSPPESTIRVTLRDHKDTEGTAESVAVAIEDEGPGIPEDKRERVFDRFYRVDEGRTRDVGGAGLGLAIAKWAVEAHGGTITLKPRAPRGAIFSVEIPVR